MKETPDDNKKDSKHTQLSALMDGLSIKRAWVKALLDQGRTYKEIQALTGASNNLIVAVKSGKGSVSIALIESIKKGLGAQFTIAAGIFLEAATQPDKVANASLSQLMVGSGISVEKARLINNESTHNIDIRSVHAQLTGKLEQLNAMLAECDEDEGEGQRGREKRQSVL